MSSNQLKGFDTHISERYNKHLLGVFNSLLAMGGMVEEQLINVHTSISQSNLAQRSELIKDVEHKINDMDMTLNDSVVHVIATNQPIASDLRLIVASVKMATELERIGDEIQRTHKLLVKNEIAMKVEDNFSFEDLTYLIADLTAMLHHALDAFARLDVDEAHKVMKSDRKVDKEFENLNRVLLTYIMQNPMRVGVYVDIANMLRSLERVGDHITNIAEHLVFIITGKDVRYMSTKKIGKMLKQDQD